MAEFQKYLCQLLNKSPKEVFQNTDILAPDDLDDMPFMGDEPRKQRLRINPMAFEKVKYRHEPQVKRRRILPAPLKGVQPVDRSSKNSTAVVRQRVIKPEQQRRRAEDIPFFEETEVPMLDDDDVPMIDESEL
jgi:hypothetical protein